MPRRRCRMSQPEVNSNMSDDTRDRAPKADSPIVIPTIQHLKAGTLSPRSISPATRQLCIQEFLAEGMFVSEIAMILKRSERTVSRDLNAIRKRNAVSPGDLKFGELLGNLLHEIT